MLFVFALAGWLVVLNVSLSAIEEPTAVADLSICSEILSS